MHSFYNLLLRLNKYHCGDLSLAKLHHDTQVEFSTTLQFCIDNILNQYVNQSEETPYYNFHVTKEPGLIFVDSEDSVGVQLADILAGFLSRYINGVCYKKIEVEPIYDEIFNRLLMFNKLIPPSCLGLNFVLPSSIRQPLFNKFGI